MKTTAAPHPVTLDFWKAQCARAWAELRAWVSPELNPFVGQTRRLDARRARWPLVMLLIVGLWCVAMSGHWAWANDQKTARPWADDAARLWIGITIVVSWGWARLRDAETLRSEVIKGRMEPIQLAPLGAVPRAWKWSAPNFLAAVLVALTMLPALAWGWGSFLSARDLLGLGVWLLIGLWSTPNWSPAAWRMQVAKTGARQSTARGAKAGDGFVLPPDLAVGARGWGALASFGFLIPLVLMRVGSAGIGASMALGYWNGLPMHLRSSGAEIWLNWPIFAARWLTEAQPFFAFALAPIWIVVPIWLASAHNRVLRLGAVTGMERFWTDARARSWRRAAQLQSALSLFLVLGLLWPGAIEGGWAAFWFAGISALITPATRALAGSVGPMTGAMATTGAALAAWWIVALGGGALAGAAVWRAALENPVGVLSLRAQLPRAARAASRALGVAMAFWLGACVLGWQWPLGAQWQRIALVSVAVAAVWLGAQAVVWSGARAPRFKAAFTVFHALWFYGVPLAAVVLVAMGYLQIAALARAAYFSPWGLWWFLREPSAGTNQTLWLALAAHAFVALAGGAWAWRLGREQITAVAAPDPLENSAQIAQLAPTEATIAAPVMPVAATVRLSRQPLKAPDVWMQRLLKWLARFDNPLLLLETRRALGGTSLKAWARAAWFVEALFAVLLLVFLPVVSALGGPTLADGSTGILMLMLAIFAFAIVATNSGAGVVYDRDRLDGSLEMLFLTPRTETEIARGKVGPLLVRAVLMALALFPLWLLGLAFCPLAGQLPLTLAYLVAPFFIFAFVVRGAVGGHWMALKKRKIGAGGTPFWVSLGVAAIIVVEIIGLASGVIAVAETWFSAPVIIAIVLACGAFYALEVRWLWRRGCRELRAWRLHGAPGVK